jgi:GxxExxY protein
MELNEITRQIIEASMKVHTQLGPGLLESAYEACLGHELKKRNLKIAQQVMLPLIYDGEKIDCGYRLDLLVEDAVIVELKAVESILPIHHVQLLSYLRLANKEIGLLINFHSLHLKDGITRKINQKEIPLRTSASSVVKSS